MAPPVSSTPSRRREGGWRDPHHSSAPYPYEYDLMSPTPYAINRGPPPPTPYHYDPQVQHPPRGHHGPPHTEYWNAPPPYGSDQPPPPINHRSGGLYWSPPPPSPYDSYRGGPTSLGSAKGAPSGYQPHLGYQYRTPSRRTYSNEPLVGLDSRLPPLSPHRKDFSPPAPATSVGQGQATRSVRLAVSASSDSEEPSSTNTSNAVTPKKEGEHNKDSDLGDEPDAKRDKNEKGDPLSVLADVSAGMGGKNKQGKLEMEGSADEPGSIKEEKDNAELGSANGSTSRITVPMPAPTSPLQRRLKPSPITPSQTPQVVLTKRKHTPGPGRHQPITPSRSHDTSSSSEARSQPSRPAWEPPPLPHGGSGGSSSGSGDLYSSNQEYNNSSQQTSGSYKSPSRRHRSGIQYGAAEFGPTFPSDPPVLVERGSFDSHGDTSYRGGVPPYPPSTPNSTRGSYFYDEHPPPPPGYGSGAGQYWDGGQPPYSPGYTTPNRMGTGVWNNANPPSSHPDHFYGPPSHHGPPPEYSYPPPPPHYGRAEDHEPAMYGGHPPPHPSYHHRGGPPPLPTHHHPGIPIHPPHINAPPPPHYPYGHPPRMEEKTILRKKFSWKHYPELERFLIANRDEYLKHSNMNYTAEQKQYNNWLTERLLEVAGQHNYMFDPDDFNFVAIRDRIRCYYKSYVQTARKRGLKLPEKKGIKSKVPSTSQAKKD